MADQPTAQLRQKVRAEHHTALGVKGRAFEGRRPVPNRPQCQPARERVLAPRFGDGSLASGGLAVQLSALKPDGTQPTGTARIARGTLTAAGRLEADGRGLELNADGARLGGGRRRRRGRRERPHRRLLRLVLAVAKRVHQVH